LLCGPLGPPGGLFASALLPAAALLYVLLCGVSGAIARLWARAAKRVKACNADSMPR